MRLFAGITHLVGSKAITLLEGTGRLAGDHAVEISFNDNSKQKVVTGEIIVVAAGSMPRTLPGFDVDGHTVLTSEELLELDSLPTERRHHWRRSYWLLIRVNVVRPLEAGHHYRNNRNACGTDADIAKSLQRSFKRGIEVMTGASASSLNLTRRERLSI